MASALGDAGLLRAYVTTIASGSRGERLVAGLPRRLAALAGELSLRPLPEHLTPEVLRRTATSFELLRVAALRAGLAPRLLERLNRLTFERFDQGVSRLLEPGDGALIGLSMASVRSFRRARSLGVKALLDYPIAHHSWAERLLQEEARREPAYASTLQFHALSAARKAAAEEELALADKIFVLSSFQRRTFVESGIDPARLVQTPLGVELDLFRPAPERRAEDGRYRVLFVGQITQRKGISYLVEGFRRAAVPGAELTLLGRIVGEERPWAAHPGIVQLPPVRFFDLPPVYHDADVFVLPSLIEGFPQTALQAMASGLPVVVSEHTFGEDVITDGVDGYVVPIRDADAIAERLRHLHANPELRASMGAAARRRAEEFSWERYGERVVAAVRAELDA